MRHTNHTAAAIERHARASIVRHARASSYSPAKPLPVWQVASGMALALCGAAMALAAMVLA